MRPLPGRSATGRETLHGFYEGILRFIYRIWEKILLANTLALGADPCFGAIAERNLSFGAAWLGAIFYSLQILFDFSGYSDMAIGLGKMFGFEFLENFNYPYISRTVTEFWRRWHISLSSWFRDYVYIPLGGSRVSSGRGTFSICSWCGCSPASGTASTGRSSSGGSCTSWCSPSKK